MSIISDLENTITDLEQTNAKKAREYKNALKILKGEEVKKCNLKNVINDLKIAFMFEESEEYREAIEKLERRV